MGQKTNWLNELRTLVVGGTALVAGLTLYHILIVTIGSAAAAVTVPGNPAGPEKFEVGGQQLTYVSTELSILDPTPRQIALYLATRVPTMLVLMAVLGMLLRLLSRAGRENPFTAATVRGLRWIAGVTIAGGTMAGLVEAGAGFALSEGLSAGRAGGLWEVPLLWTLVGMGCLAVSEIVARGCAMRQELDEIV